MEDIHIWILHHFSPACLSHCSWGNREERSLGWQEQEDGENLPDAFHYCLLPHPLGLHNQLLAELGRLGEAKTQAVLEGTWLLLLVHPGHLMGPGPGPTP